MDLNFICGLYDRVLPLFTGEVRVNGFDLRFHLSDDPREVFDLMARTSRYDASEMSISEYVTSASLGSSPFVALPVFLSKVFRHGFIFINQNKGIYGPRDLARRRIGVPLYTQSAAVWIRGILTSEYGVDLSEVSWVHGAMNRAGRYGNPQIPPLLKAIDLEPAPDGRSLNDMLVQGELDAVIGAEIPEGYRRVPFIQRLFPDFCEREKEYYQRTLIFPIMHVLVLRRSFLERHPPAGQAFYDAMCAAKNLSIKKMRDVSATRYMLPWLVSELEEIDAVFGQDHWSYGIEPNRLALEQFIKYMIDQSLISAYMNADSLFHFVREKP